MCTSRYTINQCAMDYWFFSTIQLFASALLCHSSIATFLKTDSMTLHSYRLLTFHVWHYGMPICRSKLSKLYSQGIAGTVLYAILVVIFVHLLYKVTAIDFAQLS